MWWSYVPHFINTPGYVYAYAYGLLLALSVYGRYPERATRSSRATWSCSRPAALAAPRQLAEIVGIDLADPGFWDSGLALVEAAAHRSRGAGRAPLAV